MRLYAIAYLVWSVVLWVVGHQEAAFFCVLVSIALGQLAARPSSAAAPPLKGPQ